MKQSVLVFLILRTFSMHKRKRSEAILSALIGAWFAIADRRALHVLDEAADEVRAV